MQSNRFFIAIGPPKTGTTWLYAMLNKHPEVALPKDKEIRYFWTREFLSKNNLWSNLFGKHWHYKSKRKTFTTKIKWALKESVRKKRPKIKDIAWHLKYFCATQNDSWYLSLFPTKGVTGDITPKYSELSDDSIAHIKALLPQAKIIISLRDPIDRAWSRVKMNVLSKENEAEASKILESFTNPAQLASNNYASLIQRWHNYFEKSQIFIFHYDELREDPQGLYNRVCAFLEITPLPLKQISNRVNKGTDLPITEAYTKELVKLNYPFIEEYAKAFPNRYSNAWLQKYKAFHTKEKTNPSPTA